MRKIHPEIQDAIETFNKQKKEIPAGRLPKSMKDHKLDGNLRDYRECHLAPDVLLIYTHEEDVIDMIDICTHTDITGPREKQAAARFHNLRSRKK